MLGWGGGGNDKFVILIVFNRTAIRLVQYQPVWRELSEPLIMRRRGSENLAPPIGMSDHAPQAFGTDIKCRFNEIKCFFE